MAVSPAGRGIARARAWEESDLALRGGDDPAFRELVARWTPIMLRMALAHVRSRPAAEEIVQEAWLTVLRDLRRFEGRSSLRTWVLGIVVNLSRSRARSERRSTPLDERVCAGRSGSADAPHDRDRALGPAPWPTPEEALLAGEARRVFLTAIAALPPAQREVAVLRDVGGCTPEETCSVLGLSDTNQRVLLHRARSRVRRAVEYYFGAMEPT